MMVLQLSTLLILNRVHQNFPAIPLLLLPPKPSPTTRNIMTGIYPLILHLWFFIWLLCIIMLLCKISKMISSPKTYKKASLHLRRDCPCPHWAPPIPRLLIEGWLTAFPFEEKKQLKSFPIPFETVHLIVLSFPQFHHVVELRWRKRFSPSQVTPTQKKQYLSNKIEWRQKK